MSVRAYKLIEIKTEKSPTFNCSYDDRVMGIAEEISETGDIITIQKEQAEQELKSILAELKGLAGDQDDKEAEELRELETIFRQIIKDCGDESYCEYYCF